MCWRCCVVVDWLRWFKTTKEQTMRGYNEIEIKRKQSDYRSSVDFVDWCQIVSMRFWVSSTSLYLLQHFSILTEPPNQWNPWTIRMCSYTHTHHKNLLFVLFNVNVFTCTWTCTWWAYRFAYHWANYHCVQWLSSSLSFSFCKLNFSNRICRCSSVTVKWCILAAQQLWTVTQPP